MGSFQDSDFSSPLNWVLPRAGGCVSPSDWELREDRALFEATLSVAPSCPELSSALGMLWGRGEVAGNGTQGSRKTSWPVLGMAEWSSGIAGMDLAGAELLGA